jgi:hypothetical protein
MHRAIQKQGVAAFLRQEAPFLAGALLIAELFFRWGSFALECIGFLATWYAFSFLASKVAQLLSRGQDGRKPERSGA